eukprot:363192-Chlamydomonas_euryale.AAC.12
MGRHGGGGRRAVGSRVLPTYAVSGLSPPLPGSLCRPLRLPILLSNLLCRPHILWRQSWL